jgi:peptidoglycan/xylan/chitin deacetylase (PgdA/CDA1 family)
MRFRLPRPAVALPLSLLAAVSAAAGLVLWQPRWLVELIARAWSGAVFFVETEEPLLALTIDDGPDPRTTPRLLALLERHGARATFFLIGERAAVHEELVQRIIAEGHEIGNHMTTDRPSISLTPEAFEAALLSADSVLSRHGEPRWFRPASGWYDIEMLSTVESHGYRLALGSVYPYDGTLPLGAYMVWHVLHHAQPGSIIILHDSGERGERTIAALEKILPELTRRGLRAVTLSELSAAGRHAQ